MAIKIQKKKKEVHGEALIDSDLKLAMVNLMAAQRGVGCSDSVLLAATVETIGKKIVKSLDDVANKLNDIYRDEGLQDTLIDELGKIKEEIEDFKDNFDPRLDFDSIEEPLREIADSLKDLEIVSSAEDDD